MKDNRRIQRINSDILKILSVAINQKVKDDAIQGVTVLSVDTSADLAFAKIHVSIDGDDATQQRVFQALVAASSFLRSEISANLKIKSTPQLRLHLDKGKANAARVEELLAQIKGE